MKHILLTLTFVLIGFSLFAQEDNSWTAYRDINSELIGFKDQDGNTKIKPKFMGYTIAKRFDAIIAVMEENNGAYDSYYITKSGKIIGRDSLHIFDNSADCESEDFIRFRDKKTDKVGMFNSNGEIAIPAEYNDLTRVRNGLILALKDAEKQYLDGDKHSGCNHFKWTGGKEHLIDTNNKVLIEKFKYNNQLNLFSLKIESQANQGPNRQNFSGTNGLYYSFIDYKKEFEDWLGSALLDSFAIKKLVDATYEQITYWKDPGGWTNKLNSAFIERNYDVIKSRLLELKKDESDYFISIEGLNPFIFESARFDNYYNNCGEAKKWEYPVMKVVITHKIENDSYQDHFDFLRTKNGYKLVSLTIRNEKIE